MTDIPQLYHLWLLFCRFPSCFSCWASVERTCVFSGGGQEKTFRSLCVVVPYQGPTLCSVCAVPTTTYTFSILLSGRRRKDMTYRFSILQFFLPQWFCQPFWMPVDCVLEKE